MTSTRSQVLASLLVCLLGATIVRWWLRGDLDNYLHPRTIWVTAAGGAALVALGLIAIADRHRPRPTRFQVVVLVAVVGLIVGLRPTPLSIALVRERQTDGAAAVASRSRVDLTKLSEQFTILDWERAWESDPTHQRYLGKPVKVTGFVLVEGEQRFVGRLVITCCAIDARPVWLELEADSSFSFPPSDTWVTIEGVMAIAGSDPLVRVERVTVVDPPANPYLY